MINPGNSIAFDITTKKFVHFSCAEVQHLIVDREWSSSAWGTVQGLPDGLKPGTQESYGKEWSRYLAFSIRHGFRDIPGTDIRWSMSLLWLFLQFRSATCRPSSIASVLSALSHIGTVSGFLLATSKHDSDSLTYRQIGKMKKELKLRHRAKFAGLIAGYGPSRSTPLSKSAVSLLFSAFGVVGEGTFRALPRSDRHNLWCSAVQHARGLRFGHFIDRSYAVSDFVVDARDGTLRLVTDWHRYAGRSRYCLQFAAFPKWSSLYYDLRTPDGAVVDSVSAATISHWHFKQLRQDGEIAVFSPRKLSAFTRDDRTNWLRKSLLAALPLSEERARKMVLAVTGHSFRPGLAGDLLSEGAALTKIALILRWQGTRIVRMYAERQALCCFISSTAFRLI